MSQLTLVQQNLLRGLGLTEKEISNYKIELPIKKGQYESFSTNNREHYSHVSIINVNYGSSYDNPYNPWSNVSHNGTKPIGTTLTQYN